MNHEKMTAKIWIREEPDEPYITHTVIKRDGKCSYADYAKIVAANELGDLLQNGVGDCVVQFVLDDGECTKSFLVRTRQTVRELAYVSHMALFNEVNGLDIDDRDALVAVKNEIKRLCELINSSWHDEKLLMRVIARMRTAERHLAEIVDGNGGGK